MHRLFHPGRCRHNGWQRSVFNTDLIPSVRSGHEASPSVGTLNSLVLLDLVHHSLWEVPFSPLVQGPCRFEWLCLRGLEAFRDLRNLPVPLFFLHKSSFLKSDSWRRVGVYGSMLDTAFLEVTRQSFSYCPGNPSKLRRSFHLRFASWGLDSTLSGCV